MPKYRVIAPLVTMKTTTPQGVMYVNLGEGAPVPDDVPAESIQHHLNNNLIEEVPEPAPPAPAPAAEAQGEAAAPAVKTEAKAEAKPSPGRAQAPTARAGDAKK